MLYNELYLCLHKMSPFAPFSRYPAIRYIFFFVGPWGSRRAGSKKDAAIIGGGTQNTISFPTKNQASLANEEISDEAYFFPWMKNVAKKISGR